jgi:hypothetical protein
MAIFRLGRPIRVKAQNGCSAGSIQGSFGYQYNGFVFPFAGAPSMVPIADAGRVVADGNGNYTGSDTFSVAGVTLRSTQSGTYTVNSDCTGSSAAQDNFGNIITTDFVIVNGGAQIAAVYTQLGLTASVVLNHQ